MRKSQKNGGREVKYMEDRNKEKYTGWGEGQLGQGLGKQNRPYKKGHKIRKEKIREGHLEKK